MCIRDSKDIAWAYLRSNQAIWQLTDDDLADVITTDQYTDAYNGVTHVYFRQRFNGIEVYQANINVNIARDGSVINIGNDFVANGRAKINTTTPTLLPEQAADSAAQHLQLKPNKPFVAQQRSRTSDSVTLLSDGGIARKAIPAKLMYQQSAKGLQLVWNLEIDEVGAQNYWSMRIDATTGAFVDQTNYVIHEDFHAQAAEAGHDQGHSDVVETAAKPDATTMVGGGAYRVYAFPVESPIHGARTLVSDPANSVASPYGWHDTNGVAGAEYTVTRGNNVSAIEDGSNIGFQPNGGAGLSFDYPIDLTQGPNTYESGAITNLFYISNMMHDVMYRKGFTEAAGNFQANNYGRGGAANDAVVAEAQDALVVGDDDQPHVVERRVVEHRVDAPLVLGRDPQAARAAVVAQAFPQPKHVLLVSPAQIGEGMTVWTAGEAVSELQRGWARMVLGSFGHEQYVADESYLDMATALSGTGPAYVFMFMEAMIDAGVHMGFPRYMAEELVMQTILGSVRYAQATGRHPAELRNGVTSPGGTTAAAMSELERGGLRTVLSDGIWAAYRRSVELGKGPK